MKDTEKKLAFVNLRAEGKSYRVIGEELGLSKSTCSSWEHSLADQIETLKREKLEELYTYYGMTKEARINKLGALLSDIDGAIASKSFVELPLDKLLDLRLKYGRELQTEYKETVKSSDDTLNGILEDYNKLFEESKGGELTASEIRARVDVLDKKRDILYRIASEEKEEEEGFPFETYYSKLLRHEEG
jgi:transposase